VVAGGPPGGLWDPARWAYRPDWLPGRGWTVPFPGHHSRRGGRRHRPM